MGKANPVFKKHYGGYLKELDKLDFSLSRTILDISVDEDRRAADIPFFQTHYRVSRYGVVDHSGERPDYGTCVVLLKYPLMCPQWVPPGKDWVNYRDFRGAGTSQNVSLADYTMKTIAGVFKVAPEDIKCKGCRGEKGNCKHHAMECRVYKCIEGTGMRTCAECSDFPFVKCVGLPRFL